MGCRSVVQHFVHHDFIIMADESVQVINKPESSEVEIRHCNFYSHLSLLNNTVDVHKLDILMDKNDATHSEENTSDLE